MGVTRSVTDDVTVSVGGSKARVPLRGGLPPLPPRASASALRRLKRLAVEDFRKRLGVLRICEAIDDIAFVIAPHRMVTRRDVGLQAEDLNIRAIRFPGATRLGDRDLMRKVLV